MKITKLITLISTALVVLSQPAWARGGGGGFRGGGVAAGGFRGGAVAPQHVAGGVGSRGGGVGFGNPYGAGFRAEGFRAAPNRYVATQSAPRSPGGPTAASRNYNGGSRTSPARTYQFSGRVNHSTKSSTGSNATVARQRNRPASLTKQNMRTSDAQSATAVQRAMSNHRVFARHDGNWHHDWDRHYAHRDHGHVFVFTNGFWWGLYPWDYYPYGAYSSYPSDYYGDPYSYNDYPPDSYDYNTQDPYSYYSGYAAPTQSANAVVGSVQSQLAKLGYYHGAVDGIAGDATEAAIARYQEDKDLSVTGTITTATLQSLGLAGPTS